MDEKISISILRLQLKRINEQATLLFEIKFELSEVNRNYRVRVYLDTVKQRTYIVYTLRVHEHILHHIEL